MTPEYMRLSLLCGLVSGEIMNINRSEGENWLALTRQRAWTLTDEYLDEMIQAALGAGVPMAHIEEQRANVAMMLANDEFVAYALEMQRRADERQS